MSLQHTMVPRVDVPPERHTCGTWFRAGVTTRGCPGCYPPAPPTRPIDKLLPPLVGAR